MPRDRPQESQPQVRGARLQFKWATTLAFIIFFGSLTFYTGLYSTYKSQAGERTGSEPRHISSDVSHELDTQLEQVNVSKTWKEKGQEPEENQKEQTEWQYGGLQQRQQNQLQQAKQQEAKQQYGEEQKKQQHALQQQAQSDLSQQNNAAQISLTSSIEPQCRQGQPLDPHTHLTRNLTFDSPPGGIEKLKNAIVVEVKDASRTMPSISSFSFRYLPHIVIVDEKGKILASKSFTYLTTLVAPKWVNSTTISAILKQYTHKPAGPVRSTRPCLYNWETGVLKVVDFKVGFLHHDIEFNALTQTFLCLRRAVQKPHTALIDEIFEVNLEGEVLWHWDGNKELPFDPQKWTADGKHPDTDCVDFSIGYCKDWMHGNTIYWDIPDDVIYYNAKHQDSFFKINKKTKAIEWSVGRIGGFKMFSKYGLPQAALFYKAHGIEKIGQHRFLIFDNDYHNLTRPQSAQNKGSSFVDGRKISSRIVEMVVDPVRKEAREVWTWVAPVGRMAHQMGDADRLPNGNTVVSFTNTFAISEVTRTGDIVWELRVPGQALWYVYHFERLMLRPLITFAEPVYGGRLEVPSGGAPSIPLILFNNIRLRYLAPGKVRAFKDSQCVGQVDFLFEPNWQPTRVDLPVSVSQGTLQLELQNGDGVVGCIELLLVPLSA